MIHRQRLQLLDALVTARTGATARVLLIAVIAVVLARVWTAASEPT